MEQSSDKQTPIAWSIPRNVSADVKGVGILMMLVLHMTTLGDFYLPAYPHVSTRYLLLGFGCRMCVAVFAFLTGWFYRSSADKSLKAAIKKILVFFISYGFITALIAIITVSGCAWRPSCAELLNEFFPIGQHDDHPLMCFSWYVVFYTLCMLILPIWAQCCAIAHTGIRLAVCSIVLFGSAKLLYMCADTQVIGIDSFLFIAVPLIAYALAGCRCFTGAFTALNRKATWVKLAVTLLLFSFAFACQSLVPERLISAHDDKAMHDVLVALVYLGCGCIAVPTLFVFFDIPLIRHLHPLFGLLGKHSMNIWFIHAIFISSVTAAFFQPFITVVPEISVITMTALTLSLLFSLLITPLQNRVINRLLCLLHLKA